MESGFKTVAEIVNSLEYDGGELGFKDLKDDGYRNVLLGMAEAYMSVQDTDDCIPSSGSRTLDAILKEVRVDVRRALLASLYMDMQATLTNFLDSEAEVGE